MTRRTSRERISLPRRSRALVAEPLPLRFRLEILARLERVEEVSSLRRWTPTQQARAPPRGRRRIRGGVALRSGMSIGKDVRNFGTGSRSRPLWRIMASTRSLRSQAPKCVSCPRGPSSPNPTDGIQSRPHVHHSYSRRNMIEIS
jgi:hypothetical protein